MRRTVVPVVVAAIACALAAPALAAPARERGASGDRYIVVFRGAVKDVRGETAGRERALGFRARYRYTRALKGFAARLNSRQRARLEADPEVAFVSPDRRVSAVSAPLTAGDSAPTGVRRMEAANSSTARSASGVGVAVIDTGIDLDHPDLNAADGRNCVTSGAPADDDNGHGTHVAGSVAAENDGAGVIGVAPATRLYAAKVLDAKGNGTFSQIVCGIDWVTANAAALNIKVANMSLGGGGDPVKDCATTTDAMHKAICNSTAAGITYVVAAGNSGWDFDYASVPDVPAAYPEVLTVSAMSDSDGQPGATGGAPACRSGEYDDRYASFSNYAATSGGQAHTIAAPGTCIRSTWPGGGYNTISGTSMASPHVAGAVALCLDESGTAGPCGGLSPAQIVERVRSDAKSHNDANTGFGFSGDPLRPLSGKYFGYLDRVGLSGDSGTTNAAPTASFTYSCTDLGCSFDGSASSDSDGQIAGHSWSFGDGASAAGATASHTYAAGGTYTVTLTVTDDQGATGSQSHAVTVSSGSTVSAIELSAQGYKVKGSHRVDLAWSGSLAGSVDVYRNGTKITTTANDGAHTDAIKAKGSATYRYKVCEAGSQTCSNEATVSF